ncbi:MAG: S8 family serine peptidase [Lachnospiraceae bacterium]|nr:S8 family serine peptidase [Lachnospiraceae bacterium]
MKKFRKINKLFAIFLVSWLVFEQPISVFAMEAASIHEADTVRTDDILIIDGNEQTDLAEGNKDAESGQSATVLTEVSDTEVIQETADLSESINTGNVIDASEVIETPDTEEIQEVPDKREISETKVKDISKAQKEAGNDIVGLDEELFNSITSIDEILSDKKELREHLDDVECGIEGTDYAEEEIITAAPDEETAQIYAEGFGGELLDFEYGYALIGLDPQGTDEGMTVKEAVYASVDPSVFLPAAWPNYYGEYLGETDESVDGNFDETCEETGETCDYASLYTDPYLQSYNDDYQWQHYLLQSESAWRAGYTGNNVGVAVLDSGVLEGHEDLQIKEFYGYDYYKKELVKRTGTDDNGHGTHCTGIVGARLNKKGGSGIAPEALMHVVGIAGSEGTPDGWAVHLGINQAVKNWHVSVITMSISLAGYAPNLDEDIENAYQNGVVVFCSAGNDSSNQQQYPAAYKHAVSVGAVNRGNARAEFSTQNTKVRYSAPGVDILSTYNDGNYKYLSGTSQASPCLAGVAAVILSSGKVTQTGAKKVDQLLSLIDKCCVKSGVGKGTPDLSRLFGSASMTTVPGAPVSNKLSGSYPDDFLASVRSEAGTRIYYTTDGSKITFKNGIVSQNAKSFTGNSGSIKISGAANVTLRMIALSTTNGLCSKESVYTYKLQPPVRSITLSAPNDIKKVKKGSSLQLLAVINPGYAKNRKLIWEIVDKPEGVTVNSAGKVTVTKKAAVASFKVKASASDGSGKSAVITLNITEPDPVSSIKASPSSLTLYNGDTANSTITTKLTSKAVIHTESYVTWKSSDDSIATCTITGDTLKVNGVNSGNAVLTGIAKDGSGKKCTLKVTVLQKVTDITASVPSQIGVGKSVKPAVTVLPSNAKNKKLTWELITVPPSTTIDSCGVTVNRSSGQIKIGTKAVEGTYKIRITAQDPSAKTKTYSFKVISNPIKKMILDVSSVRIFRVSNSGKAKTSATCKVTLTEGNAVNLSVSSSAPGIATASISGTTVTISSTGNATGSAVITVASTDGSNLKKTVKVTVVNPVTKLYLSLPTGRSACLSYGKTMKLIPTFVTENGAIDATVKKLKWTSGNTDYLTVNQSGVVKAVRLTGANGYVTITAETTDGSNLKAEYNIYPGCQIKKVNISYNSAIDGYVISNVTQTGYGFYAHTYTFSVSGPAMGIRVVRDKEYSNVFYLVGYKKGKYKVTVTRNDGGGRSCSMSVTVN